MAADIADMFKFNQDNVSIFIYDWIRYIFLYKCDRRLLRNFIKIRKCVLSNISNWCANTQVRNHNHKISMKARKVFQEIIYSLIRFFIVE